MIAVADSSSLIALSICNRLDLLDMFFDKKRCQIYLFSYSRLRLTWLLKKRCQIYLFSHSRLKKGVRFIYSLTPDCV